MRAVMVMALVGVSAPAAAGTCDAPALQWAVLGGTLVDDATCDGVVLSADGDGHTAATAQLQQELDGDGAFAFRWQRLSADRGTMQARFPGGVLMFRDGEVGIYVDEARWQARGFSPLPEDLAQLGELDEVAVRIELAGDDVTVRFDGVVVIRETIAGRPARGFLGLSVIGEVGARSRIRISEAIMDTAPPAGRARGRAASRRRAAPRR